MDLIEKVFVIYLAYIGRKMLIHLACEAQIALLVAEKVTIPAKYLDFADVFSKKSVAKLPKCSDINEHSIDLKPDK